MSWEQQQQQLLLEQQAAAWCRARAKAGVRVCVGRVCAGTAELGLHRRRLLHQAATTFTHFSCEVPCATFVRIDS